MGDCSMRELSKTEINAVSGGLENGTVIGIRNALGPSNYLGLLSLSFYAGYRLGTAIYNTYTSLRY